MASFNKQDDNNTAQDEIIGFGTNYFHAFGGTIEQELDIVQQEADEGQEEAIVKAHVFPNHDYPWLKEDKKDSVLQVVCSASCTIFLTQQGRVYQTGTMHGQVFSNPTRLIVAYPRKCVQISAGRHFCIAKLEQGIGVVSWGAGHFGQLGCGKHVSSLGEAQIIPHLLPQALGTTRVKQVAAGAWHALALLDNGTCMAWGSNRKLQCGIVPPTSAKSSPTICIPQPVPFFGKFSLVSAGRLHSMGLEQDTGRVYTWGASHHGQCGHYSRKAIAPPKLVQALQKVVVVDIAAGDAHSMALTGGGRVFVWGSGMDGQLGLGGVVPMSRPKLLADLDFVAIEAGREWKHQVNTPESKGEPHFRDFSLPPMEDSTKPPPPSYSESPAAVRTVSHLSNVPKIIKIKAAGAYSLAISSSGHVYTWGYNDGGQLGLPSSKIELPLVEMTSSMMKQSSSGRLLQIRSFESKCNVLLPRRVDCLDSYYVTDAAVGPSHLWCIGTKRPSSTNTEEEQVVVGQTLYEVQEERRRRGLWKMRKRLSSGSGASIDSSSASGKLSPTILSIQAVSKDSVEQVTIPANESGLLAHAESTGMDEDGSSTTTYEEQQSTGIILPVHGEEQESPKKLAARVQELPPPPIDSPASGDSLTATSVETADEQKPMATTLKSGNSSKKAGVSPPTSPESEGKRSPLARLIGKRSKSRPTSPTESPPPSQEQQEQVNGGRPFSSISPTSPAAASMGPLGFAGGRPQLPMGNRKVQSPKTPSSSPPPENSESSTANDQRRSIARLIRGGGLKNPPSNKPQKDERSKGRVRKALMGAFGK